MKYVLPTAVALSIAALAGCERPASTSTTVVQPTKETVVQRDVPAAPAAPSSSTTIVNPPAPASPSTSVTVDATKPETTDRSRTTTTERVDTPMGTATRTQTESTKTTK